jgi:hypothetical protein
MKRIECNILIYQKDKRPEKSLNCSINPPPHPLNYKMSHIALHTSDDITLQLNMFRNLTVKEEIHRLSNPNYMRLQTDITPRMREILIDWLLAVHVKFRLLPETLSLTIVLIDQFLCKKISNRKQLQLIGATAMWLASKYVEVYCTEVYDFVHVCDHAYTKQQFLDMESMILQTINWNISFPYAHEFQHWFSHKVGLTSAEDISIVGYLVELTYQDYLYCRFLPSTLVASTIYLTLLYHNHNVTLFETCLTLGILFNQHEVEACVTMLIATLQSIKETRPKLDFVMKKWKHVSNIDMITPIVKALDAKSSHVQPEDSSHNIIAQIPMSDSPSRAMSSMTFITTPIV